MRPLARTYGIGSGRRRTECLAEGGTMEGARAGAWVWPGCPVGVRAPADSDSASASESRRAQ